MCPRAGGLSRRRLNEIIVVVVVLLALLSISYTSIFRLFTFMIFFRFDTVRDVNGDRAHNIVAVAVSLVVLDGFGCFYAFGLLLLLFFVIIM